MVNLDTSSHRLNSNRTPPPSRRMSRAVSFTHGDGHVPYRLGSPDYDFSEYASQGSFQDDAASSHSLSSPSAPDTPEDAPTSFLARNSATNPSEPVDSLEDLEPSNGDAESEVSISNSRQLVPTLVKLHEQTTESLETTTSPPRRTRKPSAVLAVGSGFSDDNLTSGLHLDEGGSQSSEDIPVVEVESTGSDSQGSGATMHEGDLDDSNRLQSSLEDSGSSAGDAGIVEKQTEAPTSSDPVSTSVVIPEVVVSEPITRDRGSSLSATASSTPPPSTFEPTFRGDSLFQEGSSSGDVLGPPIDLTSKSDDIQDDCLRSANGNGDTIVAEEPLDNTHGTSPETSDREEPYFSATSSSELGHNHGQGHGHEEDDGPGHGHVVIYYKKKFPGHMRGLSSSSTVESISSSSSGIGRLAPLKTSILETPPQQLKSPTSPRSRPESTESKISNASSVSLFSSPRTPEIMAQFPAVPDTIPSPPRVIKLRRSRPEMLNPASKPLPVSPPPPPGQSGNAKKVLPGYYDDEPSDDEKGGTTGWAKVTIVRKRYY
jgi:hypothetical protein